MKLPKFLQRKANPAYRAIFASLGQKGPIWRTADYRSYIDEGYRRCVTVYACVSTIAKNASRISWILKAGKNELDEHPLLTLLGRPNEYESGARFTEKEISFLQLAGNSYVLKVHGLTSKPPRYLYSMRPDRMTIEGSGDWKSPVSRYAYSVSGNVNEYFKPEDILHLTEFNPLDDWYGLSKIEVLARRVDISNEIAVWNKKIFESEMRIPGVVTGKTMFDLDKLRERWIERYHSSDADKGVPVFLEGEDIKFTPIASSPKDVDWIGGSKLVMREICSTLGVPSMLLGDTEATTYANYQEARRALYQETILPIMDLLRDEYNAWLVPLFGNRLYLDYDRDGIEALQEERAQKYVYLAGTDWLTVNEKREATGYDSIGSEGDVVLVGIGKIPLEQAIAEPEPVPDALAPFAGAAGDEKPDEEEPDVDEEDEDEGTGKARKSRPSQKASFWTEPERKSLLWKAFDRRLAMQERQLSPLVKKYLLAQADRVKARVLDGTANDALLDVAAESKAYVDRFFPFYERAFRYAGQAGHAATQGKLWTPAEEGKAEANGFTVDPEMLKKLRAQIAKSAHLFNETTWTEVRKGIEAAAVNNLTTEAMAQELWKSLGDRAAWEARRIASTEMTRTDGWGNHEGYKQNESIDRQAWNCQNLPTSRDDHVEADGQEVGIDEDFTIGGEAMAWPGDQRASAGNVCNCRCSTYPVVGDL